MKCISAVFATSDGVDRKQLVFDETTGLIVDFGNLQTKSDYIFDDDCLAFAGMGDIHIHAREDVSQRQIYKEDFASASAAAINGGVVHMGDMPNNPIPPVDDDSYLAKLKLTAKSQATLWLYAGIGPHTRPLSLTVPYKVYMGPSIGELFFKDKQELDHVLGFYKNQNVSFHCEDPEEMELHKHEDMHHQRRPVECEVLATETALEMIEKYSLKGKLCHYSAGEGLNKIRQARKRGVDVSLEVTPQHLYFSQEMLKGEQKNLMQMNPPIREKSDREAMLEALKNGEIQFLATDHAPHSLEEKLKGTSGLTGLDTYGAFVTWLLRQGLKAELIARVTSENPGLFANGFIEGLKKHHPAYERLGQGLGFLKKGFVANVTVLDTKRGFTLTKEMLKTKVRHNPFEGVAFPGHVKQVFIQGIPQK